MPSAVPYDYIDIGRVGRSPGRSDPMTWPFVSDAWAHRRELREAGYFVPRDGEDLTPETARALLNSYDEFLSSRGMYPRALSTPAADERTNLWASLLMGDD